MKDSYKKDEVPFAMVARELLNDPEISLKAKGIYSFMYGKPNNWNFTIKSMKSQLKEGYRVISSALQELKEKGWVTYIKNSDGSGEYHLHTKPKTRNEFLGETQNHVLAQSQRSTIAKRDRISNIDINNEKELFNEKELPSIPFQVIQYLNEKKQSSKPFKAINSNIKDIKARIKEGAKFEDFKKVIDSKVQEWDSPKMKIYIRPSTLFGNKFDSYLVQAEEKAVSNDGSDNFVFNPTSLKDAML